MIELKEKTYVDSAPNRAVKEMVSLQKKLGLGDPTVASKSVKKTYKGFHKLLETFKLIENPNDYFFNLNHPATGAVLPKYGIIRLDKNRKQMRFTVNSRTGGEFRANIPLMPKSISALCAKVKEIAPSIVFSLILEPNWQRQPNKIPQGDPVVVGRLGSEYFEIGRWDGDAEAILETIKYKKAAPGA